ncbi:MAG: nicotinamide mononucleotide transporter family protein, partial [Nocardioidaceae bacterium]
RWAGRRGLAELAVLAVLGMVVFYPVLKALGSWGPLADAWILTGSILATYGMARGWVEFWLVWIAVDAVGVPLLLGSGYYPSAAMYLVYGAFCALGFLTWVRVTRRREPAEAVPAGRTGRT